MTQSARNITEKISGGYYPTNDLSAENHCAAMIFDDHIIRKVLPSKRELLGHNEI
jgi:hypothetical protein